MELTDGLDFVFSGQDPNCNHHCNSEYKVGDIDTNIEDDWSYAGWSLIIIYSNPDKKGHQLFLYDSFIYSSMNQRIDFDGDGNTGGTISGFLVPQQASNEIDAAKLTVFVGEKDDYYNWDYLKFYGTSYSDGNTTSMYGIYDLQVCLKMVWILILFT